MKTETEFLENFRRNLVDVLGREKLSERERVIVWEVSWIDSRLEEIRKKEAERIIRLSNDTKLVKSVKNEPSTRKQVGKELNKDYDALEQQGEQDV